jgi:hypothetical protein
MKQSTRELTLVKSRKRRLLLTVIIKVILPFFVGRRQVDIDDFPIMLCDLSSKVFNEVLESMNLWKT